MLAHQNGWVECAKVLREWVINKDRDLREREGYGVNLASSPGNAGQHSPEARSSSPRRRLHVKQSIDTALNLLKSPDPNLKATQLMSSTPPSSPNRSLGEYTFYPIEPTNNFPIDPGLRRPSLPHLPQPPSNETSQRSRNRSSTSEHPRQRRPRSAGTGADRRREQQEPEIIHPIYGRGGSGRMLNSKYSLLNIFKKSQPGEGLEGPTNLSETVFNFGLTAATSGGAVGSTTASPLPMTPSHPSVTSTFDPHESTGLPNSTISGPPFRAGILAHRGSDASTRSSRFTPQISSQTANTSSPQESPPGNLQASPRGNVPLAIELHLALAQQQHRTKLDVPPHIDSPEKGNPSSPIAKSNALLVPSRNRTRSGSSSSIPPDNHLVQDEEALNAANTSFELDSEKPSPSPRPGILRGHNRTSSSGQGASPLNSRTLRFDSTSGNPNVERRGRDSPRSIPAILRSHGSMGSLTKNAQTISDSLDVNSPPRLESANRPDLAESHGKDDEDYYGQPILGAVNDPLVEGMNVPSVLLQRQRGLSFASSSETSLSPILSNDNTNSSSVAVLNSDFPFSINRPPSLSIEGHPDSSPGHLNVPTSDNRNRGDSLSSNSTSDSRIVSSSIASRSGTSVTVFTPGASSLLMSPPDSHNLLDSLKGREHPPADFEGKSLSDPAVFQIGPGSKERSVPSPLDLDITSISSHAQAEALVQRARQDVLDLANAQEISPLTGAGRSPLSARLAAYGESLALERKLREQKEEECVRKDCIQDPTHPFPPSSPEATVSLMRGDIPQKRSRDGVERQLSLENRAGPRVKRRHKDPRRPSTADGRKQLFLFLPVYKLLTQLSSFV